MFRSTADAYERYMGAWSTPLAEAFVDAVGVRPGDRTLDVGCGTGALTRALVDRSGPGLVAAIDPSEPQVAACARAAPTADVRLAGAEKIPFPDATFDATMSQLVVNFIADAAAATREMRRVSRPGGTVAACTWDYGNGMTMLRVFWDAAVEVDPSAPDEGRVMPYCTPAELERLWSDAGLEQVVTGSLVVARQYDDFDDFWSTFELGVGPGGAYCVSLDAESRDRVRTACFGALGRPVGTLPMKARAWVVTGVAP